MLNTKYILCQINKNTCNISVLPNCSHDKPSELESALLKCTYFVLINDLTVYTYVLYTCNTILG